jgi:hypothetical protein
VLAVVRLVGDQDVEVTANTRAAPAPRSPVRIGGALPYLGLRPGTDADEHAVP